MAGQRTSENRRAGRLAVGVSIALAVVLTDQAYKWWMLGPFDMAARGKVTLTPFLDLVLVWNRGISYGLLTQDSELGRIGLLAASIITVVILFVWMARTRQRMVACALGFIIGGALGNITDRLLHGAVADFFLAHAFGFYWYVFNLADVAIVAGVAVLLYDSLIGAGRHPDRVA